MLNVIAVGVCAFGAGLDVGNGAPWLAALQATFALANVACLYIRFADAEAA